MAAKRKTTTARKSRSWKDIDQKVKPRSMSEVARRRLFAQRARRVALASAAIVVGAFVARAVLLSEKGPELLAKAGRELPVKEIEVETDGTIPQSWVLKTLELDRADIDLLALDLSELRERLLETPQVSSADVARRFPDTLSITLSEREPIAKIAAVDKRGQKTLLAVDREGVVYSGVNYSRKRMRALPYLDGIRLKRASEGGFEPISGMDEVARLFEEASAFAPTIYRSWRVVSLEDAPRIILKSRVAREVRFQPGDYRSQLARLDYILDYYRGRLLEDIPMVDLTLGPQVPVKTVLARR